MKKNVFILLLVFLLTSAFCASAEVSLPGGLTAIDASAFEGDTALKGRVTLPSGVKTVGSRAFAGTGLHALVLPAGATSVEGSVLADTRAAYLYLNGADTVINGGLSGVRYVFGPAFGNASNLTNFFATETLSVNDGFYYSVTEGTAVPLCAVDGTSVGTEITIPKLVNGQPVRSLDTLTVNGCASLSLIRIPAYLTPPSNLDAQTYNTMSTTIPAGSAPSASMGETLTWTTVTQGAYGETTYVWTFNTDGIEKTVVTAEPEVSYTLGTAGSCVVSVTATDSLGDSITATAEPIPVAGVDPVYRALLIGNTYPGTAQALPGCDTDVAGMRAMLGRMTATPYRITTRSNLSATEMESAILSAFSGATVNDVSLFYFSGHGADATGTSYHGSLVGTGTTYLSVARLRTVLDQIPGKKIVIIDSCHSGQMIGKSKGEVAAVSKSTLNSFNSLVVSAFAVSSQAKGENDLASSGYYVITAAHSTEDSISMGYDSDGNGALDKYFGLFTYAMCQGSGWNMATNAVRSMSADSDSNGEITLYEAYSYARYIAQQSHPNQTAQCYPSNSSMVVWAK